MRDPCLGDQEVEHPDMLFYPRHRRVSICADIWCSYTGTVFVLGREVDLKSKLLSGHHGVGG